MNEVISWIPIIRKKKRTFIPILILIQYIEIKKELAPLPLLRSIFQYRILFRNKSILLSSKIGSVWI